MKWISVVFAALWFVLPCFSQGANHRFRSKVKINSISTTLTRISDGVSSQQGNFGSEKISFSDSGRYAVFQSVASNLVSGDINGLTDVFLYDSQTSTTTRLSVGLSASEANGQSFDPVISGDGTTVAFVSYASNLVASDTNGLPDVFKINLSTGAITRISVDSSGTEGNKGSGEPSISQDGNLIAFTSNATNLVGSDTNAVSDVFVRNISAGTTTRVSLNTSGTQGDKASYQPRISSNGAYVAFTSDATNLVGSDINACSDVFVRNLSAATTQVVSTSSSSTLGNRSSYSPDISQTGQYVVFQSRANNLIASDTNGYIDIFMKNLSTGATTLISQTSSGAQVKYDSVFPSISLDGRFVVFESKSPGYITWDSNNVSDVFIHDNLSFLTAPFSTLASNTLGNGKSIGARISGDGSKLGFGSISTNLVTSDTNGQFDLFVRANPLAGQVVNITPIANLNENGSSQDTFLVTRYGDTSSSLTVYYTVGGTATAGTDYPTLSGSITVPVASSTAAISIAPTVDSEVEPNESIILTLSENAAYTIGGKDVATAQILANDSFEINVSATDNVLAEDGLDRGNFQISRTGGTYGDLIVNISMSGTATPGADYVALSSSVVIPAGQTSVDVALIGLEDQIGEGDESIILTIASGAGYHAGSNSSANATIKDNDLYEINIQATDPVLDGSNVSDTGTFRISRSSNSSQSLTVNYALKGTAHNGVDYQTLSGVATIPAGSQYIDVTVTAIANSTVDIYKSISVEILPGSSYTLGASQTCTLVIKEQFNLPVVSIESTDATASEDGTNTGTIRISRTGSTSGSLAVNYAIGGTATNGADYASLSGSTTIPSGQSYVDITITGVEDTLVEPTETVVLALQSASTYIVDPVSSQAEVDIYDNDTPTVQIFRDLPYATESQSAKAKIRVTRTGNLTSSLTVNLNYSGAPVTGTDYVNPGSSVVIPAGADSKSFDVSALSDNSIEGNEILTISLGSSGSYSIGSASSTQVVVVDGTYKVFQDLLATTPDADITSVSISDDGRYIAFASPADNLVAGDTNGVSDIFIVDTNLKTISRVLTGNNSVPNGPSRNPMISAGGHYVVFSSRASNFNTDDQNQSEDVYLKDLTTGAVTWVSKGFTYMSQGGDSLNPFISPNGEFIVFESDATNLVWNDTNQVTDIFLYTKSTGQLERANLKAGSTQFVMDSHRPSVSADGNLIAFESRETTGGTIYAYNDIQLRNRQADTLARVSYPVSASLNDGHSGKARISSDGKSIIYQSFSSKLVYGDANATSDVFRYKMATATNEVVSNSGGGLLGNKASFFPAIDATGEFAIFVSSSRNLGGNFNCTTSAYVKSLFRKDILPIENGSLTNCSSPVREASLSNSGKFVVSTIASDLGFREIMISSNPLK